MTSKLGVSGGVMAVALGVISVGCDAGRTSQPNPEVGPLEPSQEDKQWLTVTQETSLDVVPAAETLVGVTVDPGSGKRFVLTEEGGLYSLAEQGATLVLDVTNLPVSDYVPELPFTDVAALGSDRFALTAKNEGYLFDLRNQILSRFFCYLPATEPEDTSTGQLSISQVLAAQGVDVYQITEAVTYNRALGYLFAYPITVGTSDGFVYGAEVGVFSALTGEPVSWTTVEAGELSTRGATGMIADNNGSLMLAIGTELYSYSGAASPLPLGSLEPYGVGEVSGLAAVPGSDHLLVLDGQTRQLIEFVPAN